jgi:hypothetical protein
MAPAGHIFVKTLPNRPARASRRELVRAKSLDSVPSSMSFPGPP